VLPLKGNTLYIILLLFYYCLSNYTRLEEILVSFLTFPERVRDDLVVFFSNTLLSVGFDLYIIRICVLVYFYRGMTDETNVIVVHVFDTLIHKSRYLSYIISS